MSDETVFVVNPNIDWDLVGHRTPYGANPGDYPGGDLGGVNDWMTSRQRWESYKYNPPQNLTSIYPDPDPNADPKPTWDDILRFVRITELETTIGELDGLLRENAGLRDSLARKVEVVIAGKRAGIGRGFDHLTGLVHMVEHANHAGEYFPHVTMRHLDGEPATLFLQQDVRGMLAEAAVYKNAIESAHNELASKYIKLEIIARDRTQPLEEREKAAAQSLKLRKSYPTDLPKAIEAFDPDRLPADLPTLRLVYVERLEAAALDKVKSLRGVVSQQGVDNWAACVEIDEALQRISLECATGTGCIQRAEDTIWQRTKGGGATWSEYQGKTPDTIHHEGEGDPTVNAPMVVDTEFYRDTASGKIKARAAFDKAKAAIEAVYPANVPVWHLEGQPITVLPATATLAPGVLQAELIARHPTGKTIAGTVWINDPADITPPLNEDGTVASGLAVVRSPVPGEENALALSLKFSGALAQKVSVHLQVRNVCGPSPLTLTFQP